MSKSQILFAGTYTEPTLSGLGQVLEGHGEGIHAFSFDPLIGELTELYVNKGIRNPSYLTFDPSRKYLYCVNEFKEFEGEASGAVSAFRIEDGGKLSFLNQKASHGTDPCHLIVDKTGRNLYVANFSSGNVGVLPISADGSLQDASCVVQHEGSGIDPLLQKGPHAHGVELSNDNRYAFVPELGGDQLKIYAMDVENGKLLPNVKQPYVSLKPGTGPRQFAVHPNSKYAYLINELNSTITAYKYDAQNGKIEEINTQPTLPNNYEGHSSCAELQISPDGKFLYGSNRGHDTLVICRINDEDGSICIVDHVRTRGESPRNFEINSTGEFVAVANQNSGNIVVFQRDGDTGQLTPTGSIVELGTPVCVRFL